MKLEITDKARVKLEEYKEKEVPLRMIISGLSWCGPTFALVSEKQDSDDEVYNLDGVEISVSRQVYNILEKATIEYSDRFLRRGFVIMPVPK